MHGVINRISNRWKQADIISKYRERLWLANTYWRWRTWGSKVAKDMPDIAEFLNKRTKKQDTVVIDEDDEESVHGSERGEILELIEREKRIVFKISN